MKTLLIKDIAKRIEKQLQNINCNYKVKYKDNLINIGNNIVIYYDDGTARLNVAFGFKMHNMVCASITKMLVKEFYGELEIYF